MDTRALDRVTAFTDAAVAIALTLLVLPLVDVASDAEGLPAQELLGRHAGDLLAFVLSFFVVALFWRAHRRLFEHLVRLDERLLSLNVLWLLGVVFLPVPTAVLTFGGAEQTGAALLYLSNLLFIALAGLGLSLRIRARPELRSPHTAAVARRHVRRGVITSGAIALVTVLAVPLDSAALALLIALPAVQAAAERLTRHRSRRVISTPEE